MLNCVKCKQQIRSKSELALIRTGPKKNYLRAWHAKCYEESGKKPRWIVPLKWLAFYYVLTVIALGILGFVVWVVNREFNEFSPIAILIIAAMIFGFVMLVRQLLLFFNVGNLPD